MKTQPNMFSDLTVDDDVPMPPRVIGRRGMHRKIMESMGTGCSFFWKHATRHAVRNMVRICNSPEKHFESRITEEGGVKGYRIWRTK